jgi:predicted metal-binding protein
LDLYEDAILIQGTNNITVSQISLKLEKIAISMEFYKAISFGAGSCKLCNKCNLDSCINRDKTRASMEACGIDVVSTAKNNGFEMTSMENEERVLYEFAMVLIK